MVVSTWNDLWSRFKTKGEQVHILNHIFILFCFSYIAAFSDILNSIICPSIMLLLCITVFFFLAFGAFLFV